MYKFRILYTGSFRFPDKDAASQRVLGIAKSLRNFGCEVIFCGWEQLPRDEDKKNDNYSYDGFQYYSMAELDLNPQNRFKRLVNFIFKGRKTIKWINEFTKIKKIDFVIVYNSNVYFILALYFICYRKNFKLIADCTEWYQGSHLPGGKLGIANLDNNLRINIVNPFIKNVILISSFLKKKYYYKNVNTLIIPPLVDVNDKKWYVKNDISEFPEKIKIIYSGDPGKKDLLDILFRAADKFNNINQKKIEIHIVGVDFSTLKTFFFFNKDLPDYIICHGIVPLRDVPKYYAKVNFSFLIRHNLRYANAGFPTKLVESLVCGIPVITNLTSDIGKYIIDKFNGYIIDGVTEEAVLFNMNKISDITLDYYKYMRKNAHFTAIKSFHYQIYSEPILNFLNSLK